MAIIDISWCKSLTEGQRSDMSKLRSCFYAMETRASLLYWYAHTQLKISSQQGILASALAALQLGSLRFIHLQKPKQYRSGSNGIIPRLNILSKHSSGHLSVACCGINC
jgi:hypothetical protein